MLLLTLTQSSCPPLLSPTDPPAVEPTFLEIRQGQGRSITMSCRVLRAYPTRVLTYEWRLGSKLLRTGQFDVQDSTEYTVSSLSRDSYGIYNCNIINEAGAGRCSFLVTGRPGGTVVPWCWHEWRRWTECAEASCVVGCCCFCFSSCIA